MNLVLLHKTDFTGPQRVTLSAEDYRYQHIINIHRAAVGDSITIGLLNGCIGKGVINHISSVTITIETLLDIEPPTALPLTLIIALPRPKVLRRILQTCAAMGVKTIILMHSYRVEKSYWQTPLLGCENIQQALITGLEQAKDTIMPEVILEKRFKPFVEDRLAAICENTTALVAHPYTDTPCPTQQKTPTTLIIGPEGGFIPYEIEKLQTIGCEIISIGKRILKVETVIPTLLGKLFF